MPNLDHTNSKKQKDEEERVLNFGAGPAQLPVKVLHHAQRDLMNWHHTGMGILEVSHRSKDFGDFMNATEEKLRKMMNITDEHAVIFMPGGGSLQFSAVPLNLLSSTSDGGNVHFMISGAWSRKAAEEARRVLSPFPKYKVTETVLLCRGEKDNVTIKNVAEWKLPPPEETCFIYYCDNETIDGIEMPHSSWMRETLSKVGHAKTILAGDMSSNFLSRPVHFEDFDLIFATAQKNFGTAGITVVTFRRKILPEKALMPLPTMMDYRIFDKHRSLYNTPPVFAIYVVERMLWWLEEEFSTIERIGKHNNIKAQMIWDVIKESRGFYRCPVENEAFRSRMNVIIKLPNACLEEQFVEAGEKAGFQQLRGHRTVGGIRVSLYNAIEFEDVQSLAIFMRNFQKQHQ